MEIDSRTQKKNRERAAKLSAPKPVELPSGSWRCQVMVDGKRISVVDDDPEVAHAKALALKTGLLQEKKSPASLTVGEAMDRYIESKDSILSPASTSSYRKIRQNYFQDIINMKISDLTQERIQRSINALAKDHAPKTVSNAHGFLSAVLATYRPEFMVRTTLPQKKKHEIQIPDIDQIQIMLKAAEGTKLELPLLLAVWLGLRESEIRGLTWDCIEGDFLHIKKAIVDTDRGPQEKGTKTYSGDRMIRLPQHIKDVIDKQPKMDEYIVHLSGHAMYNRFRRMCEKNGLPHYRFHDLRHTAASVAMAVGVPNTYNQQRMGHKTDNMLKNVYLHTMRSKEDEFAERINKLYESILHTNYTQENEKH